MLSSHSPPAGEMVIEYAGELIRSTLTDKRERYYDGRGIGCYMFKIDENFVVDATMRGNAARFINHSCEVRTTTFVLLFEKFSASVGGWRLNLRRREIDLHPTVTLNLRV